MATLVRRDGGELLQLFPRHMIGRSPDATTVVADDKVSRRHCSIDWDGESWVLKDLGSNNGTYVDGRRLTPNESVILTPGCLLRVGPPSHTFFVQDAAPAAIVAVSDAGETVFGSPRAFHMPGWFSVERDADQGGGVRSGRWLLTELEGEGVARNVHDQERVMAGEMGWRLHLPAWGDALVTRPVQSTETIDEGAQIAIERNASWSYIRGLVRYPGQSIDLGDHSYMEMLHLLARAREEDVAAENPDAGWVYVDSLAKDLRWVRRRLNVEVWRVREVLRAAGVPECDSIIERRASTGEIRLGVARIEIKTI